MTASGVGTLVKQWRARRSRSQLDLAYSVGVSPRHLSFVETGRSKPSPELVLAIAADLEVPLRERNTMLLAAGFAPRFERTPLDDAALGAITTPLRRLLDAHDPYPGVILDRGWDVVVANQAATRLAALLPADLAAPLNIFRASLHPDGLARHTVNFAEWAWYLLDQLDRLVSIGGNDRLSDLLDEIHGYPNIVDLRSRPRLLPEGPQLVVPYVLRVGDAELSMYTTLTTFGSPRDITLDELVVELFFPADEGTDRRLHEMSGSGSPAAQ